MNSNSFLFITTVCESGLWIFHSLGDIAGESAGLNQHVWEDPANLHLCKVFKRFLQAVKTGSSISLVALQFSSTIFHSQVHKSITQVPIVDIAREPTRTQENGTCVLQKEAAGHGSSGRESQ